MFKTLEPYRQRPVRFMELLEHQGWKLKVYGISYDRDLPRPELVEAGKALALVKLPAISADVYGLGYIGLHDGRGANFVFVDWWQDENELHHRVFISPKEDPASLEEKTHTGVSACVWDLSVIAFEREAWVECMLKNPQGPDTDAYLAKRMNEDV